MKFSRMVAVAFVAAGFLASLSPALADTGSVISIEISGPILPKTSVLYPQEGSNYPSTPQGESDLAAAASLTFPYLLTACQAAYPNITVQSDPNTPLSAEQLATNYAQVAQCAYEQYTSKPYFIPKLVDDVDICAMQLGNDWRLPTEEDLASLTDAESQHIADVLTDVSSHSTGGWGAFYFSLQIFVRATDGSIQKGDLSPGAQPRVTPLTVSGDALKNHYEGALALRCIRQS